MSGAPIFATPAAMYEAVLAATAGGRTVRNFVGTISQMDAAVLEVPTALFPRDALRFYTRFNLDELSADSAEDAAAAAVWYSAARGGGQGDYRAGLRAKLDNVVAALAAFPRSKRAVLTVPSAVDAAHSDDAAAKCLRELHFYIEGGEGGAPRTLCCTGFMRAQAASIFPKNIHFIGTVMGRVAERLSLPVGQYTHFVTTLIDERSS